MRRRGEGMTVFSTPVSFRRRRNGRSKCLGGQGPRVGATIIPCALTALIRHSMIFLRFFIHSSGSVMAACIARFATMPLLLAGLGALNAAASESDPLVTLESVVVKGQLLTTSPDQPYSVQQFSQEDFRERQVSQPEQLFREVPGMEVRSLGYGGVANSMTLRGFSGGGHGGDIGFVLDGIPLNEASSHADGYADLNVVIPLELRAMTVFKGPVSALYGNFNRAGVVALESRKGGQYAETDLSFGSFRTLDAQAAAGSKIGGATVNAAVQFYDSDGYRPQSRNNHGTVSGRAAFDLSEKTQFTISTRLHTARADTASVITQAQYNDSANFLAKDPHVQNDGTNKGYFSLRGDLSHSLSPDLKALFFAYSTTQSFTRTFTRLTNATTWQQRSEDYVRDVFGYGANLNAEKQLLGKPFNWVAGIEAYDESTRYKYADALNNGSFTANTLTAGVNGGAGTLNRDLTIRSASLLAQGEWVLAPLFRPSFGFRRDRISGNCEQRGVETRTGASAQCGSMAAFTVDTPKLGLRSTLVPGTLEARVSVAEGFSLPSDAAKFTAGLSVQPTKFRQTEVGLTLTPGTAWFVDLAHFKIDSRDEVALIDLATLTYANIGKTRRDGIEAQIRYTPVEWFEASAALARTHTEVIESAPGTAYLVGAEITGVPKTMATLVATVRPWQGYAFTAIGRSIGRYSVRQPTSASSGAMYYDGYATIDLMASYEPTQAEGKRQRYYLKVANLTDRRYATSSGVSSGVQTYNPAPPRSVMVGASLDF
ncbi:TonB-dependent receptor [Rhodocyclus tenuis]|uniref:Outer membrane receptor protein involved in Fe transport n=1 Tax=Rhodocyclus tenuis TaxID=1066 RepID=A0A840GHR1_RHOTE|nr:TonB-dependent receptor plug domain-containing protein [Rhodocyclus tenuis]MBB4247719.1 outer membrane receptor protein involved in Fe transport [Rhodocyclus tenuis]